MRGGLASPARCLLCAGACERGEGCECVQLCACVCENMCKRVQVYTNVHVCSSVCKHIQVLQECTHVCKYSTCGFRPVCEYGTFAHVCKCARVCKCVTGMCRLARTHRHVCKDLYAHVCKDSLAQVQVCVYMCACA